MNITFFAIAITVLLGFAGYATDTGMIWVTRARLQNSVDAGVLAAAQELPDSSGAGVVACEFATVKNAVRGMTGKTGSCSGKADVTFEDANTKIKVIAFRTVDPIFGRILAFPSVSVSAQATAKIGSLGSACIFPFFIAMPEVTGKAPFVDPVIFTDDSATTAGGAMRVNNGSNGTGADAVKAAVVTDDQCTDSIVREVNGTVPSGKPGDLNQFVGPPGTAEIDPLAQQAASSCPGDFTSYRTEVSPGQYAWTPGFVPADCPRIVLMPVAQNRSYGSSDTITIDGFVPFYIARVCAPSSGSSCTDPVIGAMDKGDFWGYIVRLDLTSDTYTTYDPKFGTKVVALDG